MASFFSSVQRDRSTFCTLCTFTICTQYFIFKASKASNNPFQSRRAPLSTFFDTMRLSTSFGTVRLYKFLIFSEFFYCSKGSPINFLRYFATEWMFKKSQRVPFYIFRHYATYQRLQKKFRKKFGKFFSSIFSFLRAFVVSIIFLLLLFDLFSESWELTENVLIIIINQTRGYDYWPELVPMYMEQTVFVGLVQNGVIGGSAFPADRRSPDVGQLDLPAYLVARGGPRCTLGNGLVVGHQTLHGIGTFVQNCELVFRKNLPQIFRSELHDFSRERKMLEVSPLLGICIYQVGSF